MKTKAVQKRICTAFSGMLQNGYQYSFTMYTSMDEVVVPDESAA